MQSQSSCGAMCVHGDEARRRRARLTRKVIAADIVTESGITMCGNASFRSSDARATSDVIATLVASTKNVQSDDPDQQIERVVLRSRRSSLKNRPNTV